MADKLNGRESSIVIESGEIYDLGGLQNLHAWT